MRKLLSIILLSINLSFSTDFNIWDEEKKINTYSYKTHNDNAEFQELNGMIPSSTSIISEEICMFLEGTVLTREEIRDQIILNNFNSLQGKTEFDRNFLDRLENLDSQLKTPRTAEMLAFCHETWGNRNISQNYYRILREREEQEKIEFQNNLISVTEQLVEKFGVERTREYVIEMRGHYPQAYLAQHWPNVTL